jgi:hypothetical protein
MKKNKSAANLKRSPVLLETTSHHPACSKDFKSQRWRLICGHCSRLCKSRAGLLKHIAAAHNEPEIDNSGPELTDRMADDSSRNADDDSGLGLVMSQPWSLLAEASGPPHYFEESSAASPAAVCYQTTGDRSLVLAETSPGLQAPGDQSVNTPDSTGNFQNPDEWNLTTPNATSDIQITGDCSQATPRAAADLQIMAAWSIANSDQPMLSAASHPPAVGGQDFPIVAEKQGINAHPKMLEDSLLATFSCHSKDGSPTCQYRVDTCRLESVEESASRAHWLTSSLQAEATSSSVPIDCSEQPSTPSEKTLEDSCFHDSDDELDM